MTEHYSKPLQRGIEHHRAGQLKEASIQYTQYLKEHPKCPEGLYLLSIILFQKSEYNFSHSLLIEAISQENTRSDFHNLLGCIQLKLQNYSQAEISFKKAIQLDLYNAGAYYNMGLLYQSTGQKVLAGDHIHVALYLEKSLKNHQGCVLNLKSSEN